MILGKSAEEAPVIVDAGDEGMEILILQFPEKIMVDG